MKLKKYKLGELIDVTRGTSLAGEYYSLEGYLIRLTLGNFDYQNGGFKENTSKDNLYYVGPVKKQFILNRGDIITPLTEQTPGLLGSTAIIPESCKYIQSQDVALVSCKEDMLDPMFCYYLLPSKIVKGQLGAAAQQTKIRHTTPDRIKDVSVFVPNITEQKRIGTTLAAIDKKIAINREINRNLEAMARQLYDYWFVQFDFPDENGKPYKSSGGKMVWNEKLRRYIPYDWKERRLDSLAKIFTGKKDVSKVIPGPYKFFSCAPDPIASNEYIHDGDVILVSGNGSYTGRVMFYSGKVDLYQRTYGCKNVDGPNIMPFLYCTMKSLFEPYHSGGKHGSSIPYIVLDDLAGFRFAYHKETVIKFVDLIAPVFYKFISKEEDETTLLINHRNDLLPLLMNGQVSVMPTAINCDLSLGSEQF